MKKAITLIAICFSALMATAQAHNPKLNFDYVTYVNLSTPYNTHDPSDNAHYTGYFNPGFNYFVYFPGGNCQDAYTATFFAYIDGDNQKKMFAEYDPSVRFFRTWPATLNPIATKSKLAPKYLQEFKLVDEIRYRKNVAGDIGTLSIHDFKK